MRILILLFVISLPYFLFGQGFQINLQGQKQNAMAGAGSALILDESTVFFNPGAMSLVNVNAVSFGMAPLTMKTIFHNASTKHTDHVNDGVVLPFSAYGLWGPKDSKWKVGMGVYMPFGRKADWGQDWSGKYTLTSMDLIMRTVQPTFSYQFTDRLGIGVGLMANFGKLDLQRALPIGFMDGTEGHAQLKATGKGYGWNAGVFYTIPSLMSISLVHHSMVRTKFNQGTADFSVPNSMRESFPTPNVFNNQFVLPSTTTLGLAFPVNEQFSVAVDASFVNWKVFRELAFDFAENTHELKDINSKRNYGNASSVKVGIQHQSTDKLIIRAGTAYRLSPVKEGYVSPWEVDANRFVLSAGLTYELNDHWELNASFLYENVESRTQENIESSLSGTYKAYVYAPGISIGYRW